MKLIRTTMVLILLLTLALPKTTFAPPLYSGGSGTAGDPYEINSVTNLMFLARNPDDYNKCFILIADIDLNSLDPCTTAIIAPDPNNKNLTFDGNAFTGVFDGNGHTISNLTIDTNTANGYLGLFGQVNAGGEIKNLSLRHVSITSGDNSRYIGGLAGMNKGFINNCCSGGVITGGTDMYYMGGLVGENYNGNIISCHSACKISGGNGSECLGGLVGFMLGGTMSDCFATGNVSNKYDSDYMNELGGLIGEFDGGDISYCWASGNITGGNAGSYDLGGLFGANWGDIINSFSTGNVSSGDKATYVGGLTGREGGNISGCWSSGNVTVGNNSVYVSGLAAEHEGGIISNCYSTSAIACGPDSNYIGGIVGYQDWSSTLTNCYSAGSIAGGDDSNKIGGLVGDFNTGAINHCYFINTEPNNRFGTALTAAQMTQQASFTGWDFPDTWFIAGKGATPKLYWQLIPSKCTATAGKKLNTDKVSCSGTFDAALSVIDISSKIIRLSICSPYFRQDFNFPLDANTFNLATLKYKCARTENGIKESLACDLKKYTFVFSASNLDMTGVSAPAVAKIDMGDYNSIGYLDEAIINGPKTPLSMKFLMGVTDALRVDKFALKQGKTAGSDQLTVSGAFAAEDTDVNMADCNLVVTLASQQFVIPKGSFKPAKGGYSCSNVKTTDPNGIAAASFNYNLDSWTLTIKNADIPTLSSPVRFGIAFADFNEVQPVSW